MVLHDISLGDLEFETLQAVLMPKVSGSLHLDSLFRQNDLDFFVFLSSVSSVVGTPGQSPYAAANLFMTSLAEQRRRRGVAASVINIGPVFGAGYIADRQLDPTTMMNWFAGMAMSEHDFHVLFAEAVLAGRAGSSEPVEITSGVRQVPVDQDRLPKWSSNPWMTHYLVNGGTRYSASSSSAKNIIPLKQQLSTARSQDEVYRLIKEALMAKLGSLFQLDIHSEGHGGMLSTRLDELGIDSLMATEIRSWLMDNLRVNYPVLKILSGVTVEELVTTSIAQIPPVIVPNLDTAVTIDASVEIPSPKLGFQQADSSMSSTTRISSSRSSVCSPTDLSSTDEMPTSTINSIIPYAKSAESSVLSTIELSLPQSMFWLANMLFEDNTSLNCTGVVKLNCPALRVKDMKQAVRDLCRRHEILRTSFFTQNGVAHQSISESCELKLEHHVIEDELDMEPKLREVRNHVYDLENGRTMRLILLSQGSSINHFLIIGFTHICMDGFSAQVLLKDMFQLYNNIGPQQAPLQYREYSQSQNESFASGNMHQDLQFWRDQYPDFPSDLPILRVSTATSRSNLATVDQHTSTTIVETDIKLQIQSLCRQLRVTPFHFYLTCFRALLSYYADFEDVAIGIGDANRPDDSSMSAIGVFVNFLPLRFSNMKRSTFEHEVQRTRTQAYAALQHSSAPFQAIINQ